MAGCPQYFDSIFHHFMLREGLDLGPAKCVVFTWTVVGQIVKAESGPFFGCFYANTMLYEHLTLSVYGMEFEELDTILSPEQLPSPVHALLSLLTNEHLNIRSLTKTIIAPIQNN